MHGPYQVAESSLWWSARWWPAVVVPGVGLRSSQLAREAKRCRVIRNCYSDADCRLISGKHKGPENTLRYPTWCGSLRSSEMVSSGKHCKTWNLWHKSLLMHMQAFNSCPLFDSSHMRERPPSSKHPTWCGGGEKGGGGGEGTGEGMEALDSAAHAAVSVQFHIISRCLWIRLTEGSDGHPGRSSRGAVRVGPTPSTTHRPRDDERTKATRRRARPHTTAEESSPF